MLQFYFLSIALNLCAGFALASDAICAKIAGLDSLADMVNSRRGKLSIGLSVLIVSFITLFVPAGGALIFGDMIPSALGIAMGIALLFEVFRQDALFPNEPAERQERQPIAYRTTLGLLGLAAAVLHFFLPERPFL
jgi:hypothetical protein